MTPIRAATEEEGEINRGIAADPENPEWTRADFAGADIYRNGRLVRRGIGPSTEAAMGEVFRRVRASGDRRPGVGRA